VDHLSKSYVVNDDRVEASVMSAFQSRKARSGLVGRSGGGKSTLMKILRDRAFRLRKIHINDLTVLPNSGFEVYSKLMKSPPYICKGICIMDRVSIDNVVRRCTPGRQDMSASHSRASQL